MKRTEWKAPQPEMDPPEPLIAYIKRVIQSLEDWVNENVR